MLHLKIFNISLLSTTLFINLSIAKAQTVRFQSIPGYDVGVECICNLKPARTNQQIIASGQEEPSSTTYPASAYECKGIDGAEYKIDIEDQRSKFNSLSLADYNATVQSELEGLSLRYAQGGNPVKWIRIESVSGVLTSFSFDTYARYLLYFIKNCIVYTLSVSGRKVNGKKYYSKAIKFMNSLKMI